MLTTLPNYLWPEWPSWNFSWLFDFRVFFGYLRSLSWKILNISFVTSDFIDITLHYCHIYAKYIFYLSYFLFIILKYNFIKFGPFQLCVNFIFLIFNVTDCNIDELVTSRRANCDSILCSTMSFCCFAIIYHNFNLRRFFIKCVLKY